MFLGKKDQVIKMNGLRMQFGKKIEKNCQKHRGPMHQWLGNWACFYFLNSPHVNPKSKQLQELEKIDYKRI